MTSYRGWTRPGPMPPGGIDPEPGETLEFISGNFRIFQYADGHRYSTDDVLTAWYGTTCAPRVARAADLGSGIGSVAIVAAWRLPGARFVTVEAQEISIRLARKSIRYNGLEDRFTIRQGDLRDPSIFAGDVPFDLVLGSPPYFPPGTAIEARHPQAVGARIETRGSVDDYELAAARILAPGGVFVCVAPVRTELQHLRLVRRRDVIFKEGEPPLIALFAAMRREDVPSTYEPLIEPPLTIRRRDGSTDGEYSAVRMSFGFPPGNVPAHELEVKVERSSSMPEAWSSKDERQYEDIKKSAKKRGRSTKTAKRIAAATVNKRRSSEGRTKSKKKSSSSRKKSSSKKSSSRKRSSKKRSSKKR